MDKTVDNFRSSNIPSLGKNNLTINLSTRISILECVKFVQI